MSKKNALSSLYLYLLLSILFVGSIFYLGFVAHQKDFVGIIIPYTLSFCVYVFIIFRLDVSQNFLMLMCLALLSRFILLFSFPNLSDDIYRFLWDAQLILDGQNPYLLLPEDIVSSENEGLYDQLNSKSYYSPYPPVAQVIYSIAAYSTSTLSSFSFVIKAFTLLAEIGSLYFIIKTLDLLNISRNRVFIYALNPLIIIELMGNLHFESFMVLFMISSIYFLIKDQYGKSAISFVLAIASKLLPLMFTPFILAYMGLRKSVSFLTIMGVSLLMIFIPIIIGVFSGTFLSSVGLYYQKFEFNASLYYVLREVGFLIYGWNTISTLGPLLAILTFAAICGTWYKKRDDINKNNIFLYLLFTISIYLFTATTIHPWYLALPLVFCLFTDLRFPVIWSGLIFFTYSNYSYATYHENLWIVCIEYAIVYGFLILELRKAITKKASLN